MVKPAMVYLSDTTELGTHYTLKELTGDPRVLLGKRIDSVYLDGARLASALAASEGDVTLRDIAGLTDCFYIGGTKSGALFGEALVITREDLKKDIDYSVKQRGAMAAKGRLYGPSVPGAVRGRAVLRDRPTGKRDGDAPARRD